MTYKSKEFDLIYLNKQILQIIKESFGDYYLNNKDKKNINDFIDKLKKRFGDEYEKYKNYELNNNINDTNSYLEEAEQNKSDNININNIINDNLNKNKNILEFNFINFIQQFELSKISPENNIKIKSDKDNDNDNNIINTNEINLKFPSEYSNVNEYSNLNLTKDNIELVQRNIITSATRTTRTNLISKTSSKTNLITNSNRNINNLNNNNNDINIYNNYGIFNTETRNLKTEEEKEEFPIDNNEPFKVDITSIQDNKINSKDESEFKSILIENNKNN